MIDEVCVAPLLALGFEAALISTHNSFITIKVYNSRPVLACRRPPIFQVAWHGSRITFRPHWRTEAMLAVFWASPSSLPGITRMPPTTWKRLRKSRRPETALARCAGVL